MQRNLQKMHLTGSTTQRTLTAKSKWSKTFNLHWLKLRKLKQWVTFSWCKKQPSPPEALYSPGCQYGICIYNTHHQDILGQS